MAGLSPPPGKSVRLPAAGRKAFTLAAVPFVRAVFSR